MDERLGRAQGWGRPAMAALGMVWLAACGAESAQDLPPEAPSTAEPAVTPPAIDSAQPLVDLDRGTVRSEGQQDLIPCGLPEVDRVAAQGPNILMIVVDTLRADRLGFYGYERATSPHLDALAADSLVFDHAIAPAPWTTPSMAGVFTGLPPMALGITEQPKPLPEEVKSLPELLQGMGYLTAGVVSHFYLGKKFGFHRGFDVWDQTAAGGHEDISSPWVTGLSARCLEELADRQRPFFLFAHYFDPHYDYVGHGQYPFYEGYDGVIRSQKDNFEDLRLLAKKKLLKPADFEYLKDLYDSEIAFTDEHVGRLVHRLKTLGLYDDTVIVFLADHGEMFGEREDGWIGHTKALWEELVRVPLLLKLVRSERTGRISSTVSTLAILPTLLQAAGSDLPVERSLAGPLADDSVVFSQTRRWKSLDAAYRDGWKLVVDRRTFQYRLFHLREDPGETVDRSRGRRQRLIVLRDALEAWQDSVDQMRSGFAERPDPEWTEEEKQRLRALGYVDGP